jgi:prevent-host-death family protein
MKELQLGEAKSTLSGVVDAAEQGEPTTITKHGCPAAVVISHEEWTRLKSKVASFCASSPAKAPERNCAFSTCRRAASPLRGAGCEAAKSVGC